MALALGIVPHRGGLGRPAARPGLLPGRNWGCSSSDTLNSPVRLGSAPRFLPHAASSGGNEVGKAVDREKLSTAVCIVGSGPAGHTAAIYTARAELKPLMFEGFMACDVAPGGQLTMTTLVSPREPSGARHPASVVPALPTPPSPQPQVENFPGWPEGVMGIDLMDSCRQQSVRCGAQVFTETVERIDLSRRCVATPRVPPVTLGLVSGHSGRGRSPDLPPPPPPPRPRSPFKVFTSTKEVTADAVIVSTGAYARRLHFEGADRLWNQGISACAVCDGPSPCFRDQPLAVIGGGDTAMEYATFLAKYGRSVDVFVTDGELIASKQMQAKARDHPKVRIHLNTSVVEARGQTALETVVVRDATSGEEVQHPCAGLWFAIGHEPATDFLEGQVKLDRQRYILTAPGSTVTSVPGVFAAGDVQDRK